MKAAAEGGWHRIQNFGSQVPLDEQIFSQNVLIVSNWIHRVEVSLGGK